MLPETEEDKQKVKKKTDSLTLKSNPKRPLLYSVDIFIKILQPFDFISIIGSKL